MKSGLKKIRKDKRDFDFHKSYGFTQMPTLPDNLNFDSGLWTPDQNAMGLPEGCTGFTQADLCADEDVRIYDATYIYQNTPPGGLGGRDIRDSLAWICNNDLKEYLKSTVPGSKRVGYFTIKASGLLDWFDAIRLALYSTQNEKRSVSVGTPWFDEFEYPMMNGILPMPASFNTANAAWHNWKICGWKTIGGTQYLIGKSWQGTTYADDGFCYVSRELINKLLSVSGTGAFTVSKIQPGQIQTVDLTIVETIVAFIRNLFHV